MCSLVFRAAPPPPPFYSRALIKWLSLNIKYSISLSLSSSTTRPTQATTSFHNFNFLAILRVSSCCCCCCRLFCCRYDLVRGENNFGRRSPTAGSPSIVHCTCVVCWRISLFISLLLLKFYEKKRALDPPKKGHSATGGWIMLALLDNTF